MFEEPRLVQSIFSIAIPRYVQIRRRASDFEDHLEGHYLPPSVLPVPDEVDPSLPRLVFSSTHGFSRIIVSQNSLALAISYSADYQTDTDKAQIYLNERIPMLFRLVGLLDQSEPLVSGLTSQIQLLSDTSDEVIVQHLVDRFLSGGEQGLVELQFKTSHVVDENYFSNITVQNYRSWNVELTDLLQFGSPMLPLSFKNVSQRGVQIDGDFNDRHAFNEVDGYRTSAAVAPVIVQHGFQELEKAVHAIVGTP